MAARVLKSFVIVALSVTLAGLFYCGWLAVFIPAFKTAIASLKAVGWVSAPFVTAAGFAAGVWIGERAVQNRRTPFARVFVWPFIGCTLGAAAVFWFGPMLIVFGMFVVGTVAVTIREGWLVFVTGPHANAGEAR
jgi:hypothetical protein